MFLLAFLFGVAVADAPSYTATAYTADCHGCSGITATGVPANPWGPVKLMAVDPRVLPLNRCYRLRFADGHTSVYKAADTGGKIKGRRLDLLMKSRSSAIKFGVQKVVVSGQVSCPKG